MNTHCHLDQARSAEPGELREAMCLALAGNLAQLYDEVLEAPLPEELTALVQRLEEKEREPR